VVCTVPRAGAMLMRPLLLHASSECAVSEPRRVIHLEFATDELPHGLQWHERVRSAAVEVQAKYTEQYGLQRRLPHPGPPLQRQNR
jgi:hypothetical protein